MALIADVYASDDTGNRGKQIRNARVDSVTWRLNGIHEAKVSINPLEPDASLILLDEMELAIAIRKKDASNDFDYIWQGVPKTKSGGTERIEFGCEFITTYLRDAFVIDTDRNNVGVEQMNIQTGLVTYAQALSDAGRNISIGSYTASGIARDRNYIAEEYPNVFALISAFGELDDGFDWDIEIASNGSRFFTPYFPRKGSQKDQYRTSLDQTNKTEWMKGFSFQESTVNVLTDVIVTGPNDATTGLKLRGRWTASAPLLTKYGRKMGVFSESSEGTTLAWLNARAEEIGKASLVPEVFPTIPMSDSLFGSLWHGDSFPLTVDWGAIQINDDFRIVELTVTPASDTMSVKLQKV